MPEGKIPADVERYVKEHKEKGYDEGYAWALAWSRYCEYKNPDSPHCHQGDYFEGKQSFTRSPVKKACGCGCPGCGSPTDREEEDIAVNITLSYLKRKASRRRFR